MYIPFSHLNQRQKFVIFCVIFCSQPSSLPRTATYAGIVVTVSVSPLKPSFNLHKSQAQIAWHLPDISVEKLSNFYFPHGTSCCSCFVMKLLCKFLSLTLVVWHVQAIRRLVSAYAVPLVLRQISSNGNGTLPDKSNSGTEKWFNVFLYVVLVDLSSQVNLLMPYLPFHINF